MKMNLFDSLSEINDIGNKHSDKIEVRPGRYSPAFWINLLCIKDKTNKDIVLNSSALRTFANTIGFTDIADPSKSVKINRWNRNRTYTLIQKIEFKIDNVDEANTGIISCLKNSASNLDRLINDMNDYNIKKTIGELHDNVKSHSQSFGYSMAQFSENQFEFSIADTGIGFLNELKSRSIDVVSHNEAIEWCLQKNNSTKKVEDDFSQSIPEDAIQNPFGKVPTHFRSNGNHHQGLGLHILKEFARINNGTLEISSGGGFYCLDSDGKENYSKIDQKNSGVSITLKLNLSDIRSKVNESTEKREILESINWELADDESENYQF
ncbi:hypothetical protein [Leptospira sp. GIMC2001]|uniref:hypothetical protein n=1 Tax=Leptospira sp. GIMC2001 TaxID=1513297 RepID=UPI002349089C|nr:hypothetical protein [Leptospira sp. GIMC2001]WCL51483.1 hypothetical protein O4O04_19910 [Leptospira sp. GIMC2001]